MAEQDQGPWTKYSAPASASTESGPWSNYQAPDISSEKDMAAHPPAAKPMHMEPNYTALIPTQLPSGADPHNPGNANLNAIPPEARDEVNSRLATAQGALLMANPIAEAAGAGSWEPIISGAKSVGKGILGAIGGKYLGRETGGLIGHPEAGEKVGEVAGGLWGLSGGSVPGKHQLISKLMSMAGPETAVAAEEAAPVVASEPFSLSSPAAETEPAVQSTLNFPKEPVNAAAAPGVRKTPFEMAPPTPQAPKSGVGGIVDSIFPPGPKLQPDVPLKAQMAGPEEAEAMPDLKTKYPDPAVRRMVHANGEGVVGASSPEELQSLHGLTRTDLRQALINSGEDMGQQTVSDSKMAGEGSIGRKEAFDRLLKKGLKPADILKLAKQPMMAPPEAQ